MTSHNKIWFTSDTHFNHKRICELSHRPFADFQEMNEIIIRNWNSKIALADTVYHLGDFCFSHQPAEWEKVRSRLNGAIHLIRGNHDHRSKMPKVEHLFNSVKEYDVIKVPLEDGTKQVIVLFHYQIFEWDRMAQGAWHLFGHHHYHDWRRSGEGKSFDVGVDGNNYYPLSFEDVQRRMKEREVKEHSHDGIFPPIGRG